MVGIPFALRLAPTTAFVVPLVAKKQRQHLRSHIGGAVAHQMNKTHARLRSQSIGHR